MPGTNPPRHPALQAQDEIANGARQNRLQSEQLAEMDAAGQQLANENQQLRDLMTNPSVDANVGGLAAPQENAMAPLDALYDGVNQGATLEEMGEVGMIEPAVQAMQAQGYTEEDQARLFQQLDELSKAPNTREVNPFSLGQ